MYFEKDNFQIILQDRQYLLPVVPTGYTFKEISLATINHNMVQYPRKGCDKL